MSAGSLIGITTSQSGGAWRQSVLVVKFCRLVRALRISSAMVNLQVLNIAYVIREAIPFPIEMQVVPDDPDKRTYNVSFDKMRTVLGFEPTYSPSEGVYEVYEALKTGKTSPEPWTYTVGWYRQILEAKKLIDRVVLNDRLL